ncbi:hypothetical protein LguiA_019614 [Lonicera macranthoides]
MAASSGDRIVPEAVVTEILSRLPVKSLLLFKCVCKCWYRIIKTPEFVNKHLNHYHKQNDAQLLVYHYIPEIREFRFALFPQETLSVHQDLDDVEISASLSEIIGPINGLFFFHHAVYSCRNRVALWNPATREFRSLHAPSFNLPPYFGPDFDYFGFGFDPLTNNYKVVWIRILRDDGYEAIGLRPVVQLYTLGNDTWSLLEPSLDLRLYLGSSISNCSTYSNGAYYWLTHASDFKSCKLLLFDMSSNMFREILLPDDLTSKFGALVLHNGLLAMFFCAKPFGFLGGPIDVWVMKQEGCWTKYITVEPHLEVDCALGIWKNDELFLQTSSWQLVLYNPYTHTIKNLGIRGREHSCEISVFSYKESLVSVKGGSEDWVPDNLSNALQEFLKF